jgi:hypothetical protein
MKIRERFNAWLQGKVDAYTQDKIRDAVKLWLPCTDDLLYEVVNRMDMGALASLVAANQDLILGLESSVAERLEDDIDTGEIARKVAESVDASDVASHIDMDDVCNNLDVSNYTDEIAEKVAGEIDVASCIDYDQLAEKLVEKLKEAWA